MIDDGEFGKPSFVSYGNERLGGFTPRTGGGGISPWANSREARTFPEFYQAQMGSCRRSMRGSCAPDRSPTRARPRSRPILII